MDGKNIPIRRDVGLEARQSLVVIGSHFDARGRGSRPRWHGPPIATLAEFGSTRGGDRSAVVNGLLSSQFALPVCHQKLAAVVAPGRPDFGQEIQVAVVLKD